MSLQVNRTLTTRSGFNVPSGAYVWVHETRGSDKEYKIEVKLFFFKDKASFDQGKDRFFPEEVPDNILNLSQKFEPSAYGAITSLAVQQFMGQQLESVLGAGTITLVE
jgi:hypothetical protein